MQRIARTGGGSKAVRRGSGSSLMWPALLSIVVVAGIFLIAFSRNQNLTRGVGPRPRLLATHPEDHWHVAFGIYECNAYQPNLPNLVNGGIHTHGDGLIHVEATNSAETGHGANLATFISEDNRINLSSTQLGIKGQKTYKNGDKCGSKAGRVQVLVWDSPADETADIVTKDFNKLLLKNGEVLAIAFAPTGAKISKPDSITALGNPNAAESGSPSSLPPATAPVAPSSSPSSSPPTSGP